MSDENALLMAIWKHPNDDTPRLVYADWLQETGAPANVARAEFIRAQCAMAQSDEDGPRFRAARATSNRLAKKWGTTWKAPLPKEAKRGEWERGFFQPDDRGIPLDALLRMPIRDLLVAPTRAFCVMDAVERFDDLLAWPFLDRLHTFYMREGTPAGDWVERATACPRFRNVRKISLIDCPVTARELDALLTAWQDHRIIEVRLAGSLVGDEGLRVILNHAVLPGVRALDVSGTDLTAAGVRALAESSYRPPVPKLDLYGNPIGAAGVSELIRWPGLARITNLGLNNAQITDAGAAALAGCPAVGALQWLWLGQNQIGAAGAAALADSPHLENLAELYLRDNPIPADALRALRARFGSRLHPA